jgi:predicted GNAT family N-acyltransferase
VSASDLKLEAVVASTPDLLARVFALRAAVFMAEQNCPYEEEFDGNDLAGATHILGLVKGEPAAFLRLRFFAEFVHMGRFGVLPRFRRSLISKIVIEYGIEVSRRKGYRTIYGHSQLRLGKFWSRFGFKPFEKDAKLLFSDHEYFEVRGDFEPHPKAITLMSDPYVIVRPEGAWDEPGVLDKSAARPPTNPH